ncbi:glycosyltransferase [Altericroceibacterium indicum]|uniref:glycosyltransferase n=1 Tax=Altericroceibacterium indicum TaxID=374177 RepID=UPI0031B5F1C2
MKRVLSLATLYPNAAQPRFGTFVARQLEALAARGDWDVTLINPIGLPPVAFGHYRQLAKSMHNGIENGVTVYRPRFTLIPKWGGTINPAMITRAVLPLARKLHAEQPFDLLDAQFFFPDGPATERIATALGLPFSIKARGADISYWGKLASPKKQMLAAAEKAAALLSVSGALAKDMAQIGLPSDKITIHYTGLDRALFLPRDTTDSRKSLRSALNLAIPDDAPLLTTVGALIPRKGQRLVIESLLQIERAHLLIVGTGPDAVLLKQLAGELGVEERVHFLGSLDHDMLPVVLNAADAMVLPSASEGLANAWVESLACGTPLVITKAGGAAELVRHPSAGQIVERNAPAIASGIKEVLGNAYSAQEVAANVSNFSWENNAAQLADYFTKVASRSN